MGTQSEKDAYARMFWQLSLEASGRTEQADKDEIIEELECMEMHTDWPLLRTRCQAALAELRPPQPVAVSR